MVRKIIIWGICENGKRAYQKVRSYFPKKCVVVGFGDNDSTLNDKKKNHENVFKNKFLDAKFDRIFSAEEVIAMYHNSEIHGILVGVSEKYVTQIEMQFKDHKIPVWKTINDVGLLVEEESRIPFLINDENKDLEESYKEDNYKIENGVKDSDICFVFCSSNGLYYPDDYGTFRYVINEIDRYDWENIGEAYIKKIGKIIYIRDVRKSFYVTGINERINSIDGVIAFLKKETVGYKNVIIGSSAGGYMAAILCMNLSNTLAGFVFSGQANLHAACGVTKRYYYLRKHLEDSLRSKYFDLTYDLYRNSTVIFYFYASDCEQDREQIAIYKNSACIYPYAIKSEVHGVNLPYSILKKIFLFDIDRLKKLSVMFKQSVLTDKEWVSVFGNDN